MRRHLLVRPFAVFALATSSLLAVPAIIALVDAKLMPNVNFKRMTSSAAGPTWRQMTPEQQ